MRVSSILWILLLSLAATAAQAQIYKWKDKDGVTHYSSTPPPSEVGAEEVAGREEPAPDASEEEARTSGSRARRGEPDDESEDVDEEAEEDREDTCATAVREAKDTMDTYLQTARENLKGGHITQQEYDQTRDAFSMMGRAVTISECRSATGRQREFFDCLANSYGDVMMCGNRHLED